MVDLADLGTSPDLVQSISVYDLGGRRVANYAIGGSSNGTYSFDFSGRPVGDYFAVLNSGSSRSAIPLVKP